MTTIDDVKRKIREKRKEAHSNMEHGKGEEHTEASGKFSAYTDAINLVNKIDEVRINIE